MTAVVLDPLTGDPIRVPRALPRWLNFNRGVLRACCLVMGHDDVPQYGDARLYLACTNCGRETPGWATEPRRQPIVARATKLR